MNQSSSGNEVPVRRVDRVLAFMALGITLLSILAFFAIMIATATGMKQEDFGTGIWPAVSLVPLVGLPIAFVLIIALLVVNFVRRGRAGA